MFPCSVSDEIEKCIAHAVKELRKSYTVHLVRLIHELPCHHPHMSWHWRKGFLLWTFYGNAWVVQAGSRLFWTSFFWLVLCPRESALEISVRQIKKYMVIQDACTRFHLHISICIYVNMHHAVPTWKPDEIIFWLVNSAFIIHLIALKDRMLLFLYWTYRIYSVTCR